MSRYRRYLESIDDAYRLAKLFYDALRVDKDHVNEIWNIKAYIHRRHTKLLKTTTLKTKDDYSKPILERVLSRSFLYFKNAKYANKQLSIQRYTFSTNKLWWRLVFNNSINIDYFGVTRVIEAPEIISEDKNAILISCKIHDPLRTDGFAIIDKKNREFTCFSKKLDNVKSIYNRKLRKALVTKLQ